VNDVSTSANSNKAIIGMVVVAVLAAAFWILLLSPKREQASELATEIEGQQAALVQAQSQVTEATAAREEFPSDYRQLVTLGKAVPASDETASLLVELNHVADHSHVSFDSLELSTTGGGETAPETALTQEASATSAVPAASTIPPTEAEAALLPLGATIGSAGLGVMPYNLTFSGNFFQVADFIHGVDSLVHTGKSEVGVDGRLVTLEGATGLEATFAVTTYLVPPDQGLTAGATVASPATTPTETTAPTTTGTPSSYSTESAR
jgi:Tfp pilus assembly protein PilO